MFVFPDRPVLAGVKTLHTKTSLSNGLLPETNPTFAPTVQNQEK